ncbi:MAG: hypothetical protein V1703_01320 [Candidatus Altiarchaeota archaeon]
MAEITYADIQRLYRTEGNSPVLEEIPDNFYEQVPILLSKVEPEHRQHIVKFASEIYAKRRNKIMLHALRVCNRDNPPARATNSEKALYYDAIDLIERHSNSILFNNLGKRHEEPDRHEERKVKVRILKPMPSIVGSDMKSYGPFKEDDIFELPESSATVLIKKEFAKEFEETSQPLAEE